MSPKIKTDVADVDRSDKEYDRQDLQHQLTSESTPLLVPTEGGELLGSIFAVFFNDRVQKYRPGNDIVVPILEQDLFFGTQLM